MTRPSLGDALHFGFTIPEDLSGLEISVDIVGRDDEGNLWRMPLMVMGPRPR